VNEANLNDRYFTLFGEQEKSNTFFSTESVELSTMRSLNPNAYFMARFQLSDKNIVYERVVYSVLDLIGDVGGIS